MIGERKPYAAESTGDQVHTALAKRSRGRGWQGYRFEALQPAMRSAQRHHRLNGFIQQFAHDLNGSGPRLDIDAATGQIRILLCEYSTGTEYRGLFRNDGLIAGYLLHCARD